MAVHVVGNVCLDWRFALPRLPRPGETANADALTLDLGGKGALQALAARRTGATVTLWAAVGRDADAAIVRDLLRTAGLADAGLVALDAPTDRSVILVDAAGENAIVSAVACARAFEPAASGWAEAARPGDVLVLQNNLGLTATAATLSIARRAGLRIVSNASPLAGAALADDGPRPSGAPPSRRPPPGGAATSTPPPATPDLAVDLVVVNAGEGEALTGAADPDAILAGLLARGARAAVVTLGGAGAAVRSAGGATVRIPAPSVAAVDTAGAGDVLCGVLTGLLAQGVPLAAAARVAVAAAALSVTRAGTASASPTEAEVAALVAAEGVSGAPPP